MMPGLAPQTASAGFPAPAELEEDANPFVVVFYGAHEEKELDMVERVIKAAQESAASGVVTVRVVGNYRVVHEGKGYVGGEVLEIPLDEEHKNWLQSGWVVKEVVK